MQRFLPGRHEIESFGNGGFRLGGMSHQGSILITPSGVRALPDLDHLDQLLAEKAGIDLLLIGTGRDMVPLPTAVQLLLKNAGINFDLMTTNAAVRTYNVVLAEDRRVAAILIAVDKAYG
jgi:uncharacterized protein